MRMCATPLRLAEECKALAIARTPTIADTSYWSFLMEVNQAITNQKNNPSKALGRAVKSFVTEDHTFLDVIRNPFVVPMSKTSQSDCLLEGVSDRQVLGEILKPGEYLAPRRLTEATRGSFGIEFGIEKRLFKDAERTELRDYFDNRLGVVFYKPHP